MASIPRKTMINSTDKTRKSPGRGSSSPVRATVPASPSSFTSPGRDAGGAMRASHVVLAPPPRAALSRAPSPAADTSRRGGAGNSTNRNIRAGSRAIGGNSARVSSAGVADVAGDSARQQQQQQQQQTREMGAQIAALERELAAARAELARGQLLEKRIVVVENETAPLPPSSWQAERAELRAGLEATRRGLESRDADVRALRAQVRGLKDWVSTSTRSGDGEAQTSDEILGEAMSKLGNVLQNWVLVNFRKTKICLDGASEGILEELSRLVPTYEDLAAVSKINLLQSIISRLLVEVVFEAYFVGLSDERAQQLIAVETFLRLFAGSPEPINQWRSLTFTILKKEAAQKMRAETSGVIESLISRANEILDTVTDTRSTGLRDQGLRTVVTSAVELSRLLAVQRAVFEVTMPLVLPHQRTMFDPSTMEDIGGEDEESLVEREICCVTFPGVIKRGDENGTHLQYRNVISKARVLCKPDWEAE